MDTIVAFIAFNRPHYFSQTVNSIKDQIQDQPVYLFLDGPRHADETNLVRENEKLFCEAFPNGIVMALDKNIGAELNQVRLANTVFGEFGAMHCFWIEDDWIFEPNYFEQLKLMVDFCDKEKDIATMNCYGIETRQWTTEELNRRSNHIVCQHTQCGLMWKRKTWEDLVPHLNFYEDACKRYTSKSVFDEHVKSYAKNLNVYLEGFGFDEFYSRILGSQCKIKASTAGEYATNIGVYGTCSNGFICSWHRRQVYPHVVRNFHFDKNEISIRCQMTWQVGSDWIDKVSKICAEAPGYHAGVII